jgi:hypothetical protein
MYDSVLETPGWKTFFSSVIPAVSAIFSGTFVFEITTQAGLDWKAFYRTKSFYCLILTVVIIYLYNRAVYVHEKKINSFRDKDYCLAYMRSKCLPEAAEKYRERIRSGNGGELEQAMSELKKILR